SRLRISRWYLIFGTCSVLPLLLCVSAFPPALQIAPSLVGLQEARPRGNSKGVMTAGARQSESAPADRKPAVDWSAAFAEHGRWLRTVVLARVGETQAVDEVLQEVLLAAVSGRAPLKDDAKLAPWLYRLAVTQSLLYRRKAGRQ